MAIKAEIGHLKSGMSYSAMREELYKTQANNLLDKVEIWASGYWLIRETGIVDVQGRLDALLIPVGADAGIMKDNTDEWFWDRIGIVGVEVKVSRSDFLGGLRKEQYQRYQQKLSALYIATPSHESNGRLICTKNEIPDGVGWLCLNTKKHGWSARSIICRKAATFTHRDFSPDTMWRLIFKLKDHYIHALRTIETRYDDKLKSIGNRLGETVYTAIQKL